MICGGVLTACGRGGGGASTANSGAPPGKAACGGRNALTAQGSTAQQNAIALFNQVWGQLCPGKNVSYNPTASSEGREQFIAGRVDFAGSDSPLVAAQIGPAANRCKGNAAWDLPLVFGPIALVYNLTGVQTLVVDADALAKIFSGSLRTWNDPILAALNPGVALPNTEVTPIYRKDPSGTTDNFQKYLTAAAPQSWTKGVGSEFQGGVGEGAQRSAGVVQALQAAPGSIGYVERGVADHAGLPFAQINTGNVVVPLTDQTARNAIDAVTFAANGNDLVLEMNSVYGIEDPGAYPLVMATYEIVCSKGYDPDTSAAVRAFLTTALNNGQTGLSSAGYVPVPDKVKERLVTAINAMQ
jgi:phosphate transport system substrate-binding protein